VQFLTYSRRVLKLDVNQCICSTQDLCFKISQGTEHVNFDTIINNRLIWFVFCQTSCHTRWLTELASSQ